MQEEVLLRVRGLKTYFYTEDGVMPSVDDVDFDLHAGETLAIVGESGCGKSVTSLSVMGLIQSPPGKIVDGQILYRGTDLLKLSKKEMRNIRGNEISMIFQEPMTSLNPVFTVGSQIADAYVIHRKLSKKAAWEKTVEMIRMVGIPDPEKMADKYPHELSGGMRQRIMIAMALACEPRILIADEPTTALDVTIQAQIMQLLKDLKNKTGTSIIIITHDLGVVAQIAQTAMVMYAGQVVEYAPARAIYKDPLHPYTVCLLKSVPQLGQEVDTLFSIQGMVPSPKDYPKGCRFSPRCPCACPLCAEAEPPFVTMEDGRRVRCWKYDEKEGQRFG
ncbi:MAG: ABC transporter ATP-binding protein [Eubacteriales bacterium]|nr:ABC transporter ATP-binding protein [Eubacteriales bacterium]